MHHAWERCPELCTADPSLSLELGCERHRKEAWVLGPGLEVHRCPMSYVLHLDEWSTAVLALADDRDHHVAPSWPDGWSDATVQDVRLLARERSACTAETMRRDRPKPP